MNFGPNRKTVTQTVTTVRHVLSAFGTARTNPPSLGQLREFVAACEGLPDYTSVTVETGRLDEGGRHTMTLSIRIVDEQPGAPSGPETEVVGA